MEDEDRRPTEGEPGEQEQRTDGGESIDPTDGPEPTSTDDQAGGDATTDRAEQARGRTTDFGDTPEEATSGSRTRA